MNEPKIRLKGFSGEWEVSRLDACVDFLDNMRKPIDEGSRIKGIYPYYGASGIVDYVNDYIFDEELILLSEDGANITDRNYPVCFLASGKYWVNNHAHVLKAKEGFVNNFITNAMECKDYTQYNTGMAMPKLNKEVCKRIHLAHPNKDEQKAIGAYFQHLDSLIQSTTKKIESLKQVKAASLQSMFPQEGETTPRVRFKGFDGEWEMDSIKNIATFSKGRGYSKSDLRDFGTPIVLYGRLYTKYEVSIYNVDTYVNPSQNSVYSFGDEVIMPASGETPEDISIASAILSKGIILGGDLNVMRFDTSKNNTTFIALSLSFGKAKKDLSNMAQGKSVVHLHNSDIEKISIPIPSYEEQQKIASYFTNLDSQINLQTQRLEKLKQIKSACLDNMFV